jgi:outer membrane lipoprotein-sorting protein
MFYKNGLIKSLLCVFFVSCAHSAQPSKACLQPHSVEAYNTCIKKLNSVVANFVQKNRNREISGKLYLQKPGKLRIIYKNCPQKGHRQILCDGEYLTEYVFDNKGHLEESSSVALSDTPLELILNTNGIDFERMQVQRMDSIKRNQDTYTHLYIAKKDEPNAGHVILVFKEQKGALPLFCGWILHDEHQEATSLELNDVHNNVIILPKTFSTTTPAE